MIKSGLVNQKRARFEQGFGYDRDPRPRDYLIRPWVSGMDGPLIKKSRYADPYVEDKGSILVSQKPLAEIKYDSIFGKTLSPDERLYLFRELNTKQHIAPPPGAPGGGGGGTPGGGPPGTWGNLPPPGPRYYYDYGSGAESGNEGGDDLQDQLDAVLTTGLSEWRQLLADQARRAAQQNNRARVGFADPGLNLQSPDFSRRGGSDHHDQATIDVGDVVVGTNPLPGYSSASTPNAKFVADLIAGGAKDLSDKAVDLLSRGASGGANLAGNLLFQGIKGTGGVLLKGSKGALGVGISGIGQGFSTGKVILDKGKQVVRKTINDMSEQQKKRKQEMIEVSPNGRTAAELELLMRNNTGGVDRRHRHLDYGIADSFLRRTENANTLGVTNVRPAPGPSRSFGFNPDADSSPEEAEVVGPRYPTRIRTKTKKLGTYITKAQRKASDQPKPGEAAFSSEGDS